MPSSVIKAFAYDAGRQILTVTFVGGRAYAYAGVPAEIAQGLRLAFAKGEYFNTAIRDRFKSARVTAGTLAQPGSLL